MKLTEQKALDILLQDIKHRKELTYPENRWILHSIYVGLASKRIAEAIRINDEKAAILGYLHDIGRRINHQNHPIEGYKYLQKLGYEEEAKICLTHSFIDNNITKTAGGGPKDLESYRFLHSFLTINPYTIYDNIIQLCDLFCLETGFTTIEKRLLDIASRKGIFDNSYSHYKSTIELKNRIENKMNQNLYNLFPEISSEDLQNLNQQQIELQILLTSKQKKKE